MTDGPVTDIEEVAGGDRIMPHSIELEQQVLGAMILSRAAVAKAVALIDRQVFYRGRHREIFDGIVRLYEAGKPADLSLLAEELEHKGVLEECGGPAYLADIAASVGTSANIEYHAKALIEKAIRRRTIALSSRMTADCFDVTGDVYESLDKFQHELFTLSERRWRGLMRPIGAAADEALDWYAAAAATPDGITGLRSGWPHLDRLTAGFQPGELAIVAARPGMGKTAFCLNVAHRAAIIDNVPVGVFSLEMKEPAIAARLMVMDARIDSHYWRTGKLNADEAKLIDRAHDKLRAAPIHITGQSGLSALEIRAKSQQIIHAYGVRAIFVDYLQLVRPPRTLENRATEVGQIAADLKAIAMDLSIPVIVACQVTRDVEKRGDNRPKLSDLRESGGIEQEADLVLFLHRPEYYGQTTDKDGHDLRGVTEVIIGKQRNGPQGTARLWWRAFCGRFDAMADAEHAAYGGDEDDDSPY